MEPNHRCRAMHTELNPDMTLELILSRHKLERGLVLDRLNIFGQGVVGALLALPESEP